MKTVMKNLLGFFIVFFILFSFNCYADKALTTQQKKAEERFKKAYSADTLLLQIEYYSKVIKLDPKYAYAIQKSPIPACDNFYQAGILFLEQNNTTQSLVCVTR